MAGRFMGEKHILRFRRIEFEIVRRKSERDLVKVSLENMHVRESMGWKMRMSSA